MADRFGYEYEVLWSGAHKDTYLCIPPLVMGEAVRARPGDLQPRATRSYTTQEHVKRELLALLPTKKVWRVADLIERMRGRNTTVYALLFAMRMAGTVRSSGYGRVSWVQE